MPPEARFLSLTAVGPLLKHLAAGQVMDRLPHMGPTEANGQTVNSPLVTALELVSDLEMVAAAP